MNQTIRDIESSFLKEKDSLPELNVGDTVKVFVKIKEGGKERTQGYEGVIIKRRGSGVNASITVRRVFQGIGIERVFPLHSPGSKASRFKDVDRSDAPSSTICATEPVKLPESKKKS